MEIFNQVNLIYIAGKSRSGKSYLIKYLIQGALKNRKIGIKFGLVFCTSKFDKFDKSSYSYLPDKFVLSMYSDEVLGRYLKMLEKFAEKGNEIPRNFIIFDDVIGSLKNSDLFKHFISTYRKYNCWVFIASQYTSAINTLAREQICYAFIFRQTTKPSIKLLYEAVGSDFDSDKEFKEKLDEYTKEKFSCMLYIADMQEKEQKYIHFKAPKKVSNYKFAF